MGAWLAFSVFIYSLGLIYGSIMMGTNLWDIPSMVAVLNPVAGYQIASTTQAWGQMVNPLFWPTYFECIYKIITFDLPIWGATGSPLQLLRLVFIGPIIACIVYGLIITIISIFSYILS